MATTFYNRGKADILRGLVDHVNADLRVLLVTSAYSPNPDSDFVASVTNEVVASGYVRKVLAGKTVTEIDASDVAMFDANDVTWTALATCSPARVVVFKQVTNDADSVLLACIDLTSPPVANGGDYTVQFNASGLYRL